MHLTPHLLASDEKWPLSLRRKASDWPRPVRGPVLRPPSPCISESLREVSLVLPSFPEADEMLAAQRGLLSTFPWVALGTALLVC